MIDNSINLKKKIDNFRAKFLSKEEFIKFEENYLDKILGKVFSSIKKVSLPTIKVILNSIMKITDKFLDFITQQNELKLKISKQEEILSINTKLNQELSLQVKQLNRKIDNLNKDNKINSSETQSKINENQITTSTENKDLKSAKINEIRFSIF